MLSIASASSKFPNLGVARFARSSSTCRRATSSRAQPGQLAVHLPAVEYTKLCRDSIGSASAPRVSRRLLFSPLPGIVAVVLLQRRHTWYCDKGTVSFFVISRWLRIHATHASQPRDLRAALGRVPRRSQVGGGDAPNIHGITHRGVSKPHFHVVFRRIANKFHRNSVSKRLDGDSTRIIGRYTFAAFTKATTSF